MLFRYKHMLHVRPYMYTASHAQVNVQVVFSTRVDMSLLDVSVSRTKEIESRTAVFGLLKLL